MYRSLIALVLLAGMARAATACSPAVGSNVSNNPPVTAKLRCEVPQSREVQAAEGARIYAAECARCHASAKVAPAILASDSPDAGTVLPIDPPATARQRQTRFATAADVHSFVMKTMPPGSPGQLRECDSLAVTAHILESSKRADFAKIDAGPLEPVNAETVLLKH